MYGNERLELFHRARLLLKQVLEVRTPAKHEVVHSHVNELEHIREHFLELRTRVVERMQHLGMKPSDGAAAIDPFVAAVADMIIVAKGHLSHLSAELKLPGTNTPIITASESDAPWPEYISARDLANRLGLPVDATRKKLERMKKFDFFIETDARRPREPIDATRKKLERMKKFDFRIETEGRRPREPKYLYRVEDVLPLLK